MPRFCLPIAVLLIAASASAADKPSAEGVEFFEKKVRPLLVKHCYACHSADAKSVKGDLLLDSREAVRKGGDSGPVAVAGDPAKSLLIKAVKHADGVAAMPPKAKLTAAEIADLEAWVTMGLPDPRDVAGTSAKRLDLAAAKNFWSFRPVGNPQPPAGAANPIDAFVAARLAEKGLKPVAAADRRTLIRRVTYDLTGLPPTPEEVEAFLKDDAKDAFAKVVDRLLASPAYGERWGRHWLDVVRYADTAGDNSDYPIPQMYRYRNWVIDAFNRDLPYDEFVRQQLAGDLLPAADEGDRHAKLVATGYLANARRFGSYEDKRYPWHLTIEDTIDNFGRTFLGLTVNCCRCHDHKFDPLSQADYYALYGFFQSTRYPWPGIELDQRPHDLVPLAAADAVAAFEKDHRTRKDAIDAKLAKLEADKKAAVKEAGSADADVAAKGKKAVADLDAAIKATKKERDLLPKPPYELAYAVQDKTATGGAAKVGNACVQIKGDPEHLGPEVPRRFITVLGGQPLTGEGSGRLQLAAWVVDPANPLTARVMVNRLWQGHFGKGLVTTASNFGFLGDPPTHPDLLDFLARRFVAGGWSVKAMHRLIVTSRTYQLASTDDPANAKLDVGNRYLWRFDRRRLDAEAIRDTLLALAGDLDRTPGGPHPFPPTSAWDFTQHKPFRASYDTTRRSVYLMTQRIQRDPFLALFDGPDTNASTATRTTSTTPLQSLYLMNDPFVHARASSFAARLLKEAGDDAARTDRAYRLLFGRPPTTDEAATVADYLATVGGKLKDVPAGQRPARAWASLARALFLSNEFVYVD